MALAIIIGIDDIKDIPTTLKYSLKTNGPITVTKPKLAPLFESNFLQI
jgi:hypothetical protein